MAEWMSYYPKEVKNSVIDSSLIDMAARVDKTSRRATSMILNVISRFPPAVKATG